MAKRGFVGNVLALIGMAVFVLIAVAVIPTVSTTTVGVAGNGSGIAGYGNANVTGATNALVTLTPLIFVASIIIGLLMYMRGG